MACRGRKTTRTRTLPARRRYATQLAALLENRPNPVAAQFALDAVQNHVKNGTDPSLAGARQALDAAATNVRDWASGALDQNTAIQSLKDATELLR